MKIGYQGVEGSYSEGALFDHFGRDAEAIGFPTFKHIFKAVMEGELDAGVVPVDNSIGGRIARNFDLLLAYDVAISAEILCPISHSLLGQKGSKLSDIKKVYSHEQALEQCSDYIEEKGFEPHVASDTAGAAKRLKEKGVAHSAAIASQLAAEIYDLDILAEGIENRHENVTRFFVIVKPENVSKDLICEKTSIAFKVKHYPGSLVNCLQRMAKNDVNMTKLESRPVPGEPGEFVFYADFEGGVTDKNVALTLSEMEAASYYVKVLGSYPKG